MIGPTVLGDYAARNRARTSSPRRFVPYEYRRGWNTLVVGSRGYLGKLKIGNRPCPTVSSVACLHWAEGVSMSPPPPPSKKPAPRRGCAIVYGVLASHWLASVSRCSLLAEWTRGTPGPFLERKPERQRPMKPRLRTCSARQCAKNANSAESRGGLLPSTPLEGCWGI